MFFLCLPDFLNKPYYLYLHAAGGMCLGLLCTAVLVSRMLGLGCQSLAGGRASSPPWLLGLATLLELAKPLVLTSGVTPEAAIYVLPMVLILVITRNLGLSRSWGQDSEKNCQQSRQMNDRTQ